MRSASIPEQLDKDAAKEMAGSGWCAEVEAEFDDLAQGSGVVTREQVLSKYGQREEEAAVEIQSAYRGMEGRSEVECMRTYQPAVEKTIKRRQKQKLLLQQQPTQAKAQQPTQQPTTGQKQGLRGQAAPLAS